MEINPEGVDLRISANYNHFNFIDITSDQIYKVNTATSRRIKEVVVMVRKNDRGEVRLYSFATALYVNGYDFEDWSDTEIIFDSREPNNDGC